MTLLVALLAILLIPKLSDGQEIENANPKFGLGVSLFNITEYEWDLDASSSIYTTFDINDKFRLEPTLGLEISSSNIEYSIELGTFGKKTISKFNFLYGLRLGFNSAETVIIAPAVGGEYYFIKNFSIGSEIQLRGLMLNNNNWFVVTNSSVIIRYYF